MYLKVIYCTNRVNLSRTRIPSPPSLLFVPASSCQKVPSLYPCIMYVSMVFTTQNYPILKSTLLLKVGVEAESWERRESVGTSDFSFKQDDDKVPATRQKAR